MRHNYLWGPAAIESSCEWLLADRQAGQCLSFGRPGAADLTIPWDEPWHSVCDRFPAGWQPDFVVLNLPYATIPHGLWSAPVPLVGCAGDWNFLWHGYRRLLPLCDLVLTDLPGAEVMRREGLQHARAARLYGCDPSFVEVSSSAATRPDRPRDIDILFVGNLHPAVQRERLPWLGRLARFADRYRVVIETGVPVEAYRDLLCRARIVFNYQARGRCNQRVFEAAAGGALLFQEAENREVPAIFRDRQECVYFTSENLEELLEHYLTQEEERIALARTAQARIPDLRRDTLWQHGLKSIENELPTQGTRARERSARAGDLIGRVWQALSSTEGPDSALVHDLTAALASQPGSPDLANCLGLAIALHGKVHNGLRADAARRAAEQFEQAIRLDPTFVVADLNLAEVLWDLGNDQQAREHARRALETLDGQSEINPSVWDAVHYPPEFDRFRIEWERAAWSNAGQPDGEIRAKSELLRWRLHVLLAELTRDLAHYREAAVIRPDLPILQAALGCALGRAGRPAEAVSHLSRAVADNPFDLTAARALFVALGECGQTEAQDHLANDRRLLARAAPQVVELEPWFAKVEPASVSSRASSAESKVQPEGLPRIIWEGSQRAIHSLAIINRAMCSHLLKRGHTISFIATDSQEVATPQVPINPVLSVGSSLPPAEEVPVHVRHRWPPNFEPPPDGYWVMYQPWEFGSLPAAWLRPMCEDIDEVWVPSHFVRDGFVRSGLPADRVHIVPYGVDPTQFYPHVAPSPLKTTKRFKFLFVGGTIYHKGIDLLLETYSQAFTAEDDVCLVVKDLGVSTIYRGQTAEESIARYQQALGAPAIEYLPQAIPNEELPGLYLACDCLVHPYRGEGFGLPIAEAMACGRPVLITGYGAALDFCDESVGYLIPAQVVRLPEKRLGDLETVDYPWLAEPDREALRVLLRHVYEHPEEAKAKGQAATSRIHSHFTWDHAVDALERRLVDLQRRPIRRHGHRVDPQVSFVHDAASPMVRTSLCMIVKNEEHNLPDCLRSVQGIVDEMIIVDTGSTDRTREIAAQFGARVWDFPWVDSFAAARNECLRRATGEWIFWMDADDRLDEDNRKRLRQLFAGLNDENAAYVMKCLCLPDPESRTTTAVDHVRLFRNRPDIRWRYRVHKQILPAIRQTGAEVRWADVVIHHVGYQDPAVRGRKLERDLRLLRLEDAERPDDAFTLFNLGSVYLELARPAEALPILWRSVERSQPADSIVRKLYALIAQSHRQLGQPQQALAACRAGRHYYSDDVELLFQEGSLLREAGDNGGAETCWLRLLESREGAHFKSVDAGLAGYKTHHNLALLYREQGRDLEAEAQWRAALVKRPDFLPAQLGLGDLLLGHGRWTELDQVVSYLESDAQSVEALALRARGCLARREFSEARRLLGQAVTDSPRALWPRVLLSHALLQEGVDWTGAERALRDVLAMDPGHTEARHNLQVLLQQQGRVPVGTT